MRRARSRFASRRARFLLQVFPAHPRWRKCREHAQQTEFGRCVIDAGSKESKPEDGAEAAFAHVPENCMPAAKAAAARAFFVRSGAAVRSTLRDEDEASASGPKRANNVGGPGPGGPSRGGKMLSPRRHHIFIAVGFGQTRRGMRGVGVNTA